MSREEYYAKKNRDPNAKAMSPTPSLLLCAHAAVKLIVPAAAEHATLSLLSVNEHLLHHDEPSMFFFFVKAPQDALPFASWSFFS